MFAVDDELESSPKHEALDALPPARRARAFEAWLRLGAASRKRGTGGLVTAALAEKILHKWKASERAETLADLVAAKGGRVNGLLVVEGDAWRFHEWDVWQPDENEATAERKTVSKKTLRQRRWRHGKRHDVDAEETPPPSTERLHEPSTVDAPAPPTETPTERLPDVSRARRAPATRVRVPDPVPIPTLPSKILDREQDPSVSVAMTRLQQGFSSRWREKRDARGVALGDMWPGFGKHAHRATQIAEAYADKLDRLDATLDAFFASTKPIVAEARWTFGMYASDPARWLAEAGHRAPNAKHTTTTDEELDRLFGPADGGDAT